MPKAITDVRTKVSEEDGVFLQTVAIAMGTDAASVVRGVIHDFLAAKRREYSIAARMTRCEGFVGAPRGHDND